MLKSLNVIKELVLKYSGSVIFSFPLFFILAVSICSCRHEIVLPGDKTDPNRVELILIHFNDGESHLLNAGPGEEDFGGIARFAKVIQGIRKNADADVTGNACITVSSGDNFLTGQIFDLSLKKGIPYYDAMALDMIGIDAIGLGNHDFDLGPDVLAKFIGSFRYTKPVFLGANLDFSKEKSLFSLRKAGCLAKSTIIERGRKRFGVIGVVTPDLRMISSPGNVKVRKDLANVINEEVRKLKSFGINKIILVSHLQGIRNELELIKKTSDIDIVVAGGGNELLANYENLLISNDIKSNEKIYGTYPIYVKNADNKIVPVVTTSGDYRYVGCLKVNFDSKGELVYVMPGSGPVRVAGDGYPDAVEPDKQIQQSVILPIAKSLSTSSTIIGTSKVYLDGERQHVRSRETNLGDLVADSVLWMAQQNAARYNTRMPVVAMINGGSIRSSINQGNISEADIYRACPFNNIITVVESLTPKALKDVFESSLAELREDSLTNKEPDSGRFPQLSNISIIYNPTRPVGNRIKEIRLDSGDIIVQNYKLVKFAPSVDVATLDFLARGGDDWNFGKNKKVNIGISVVNAIKSYITSSNIKGGLNKIILEKQYPKNGKKRIFVTRE